MQLNVRSPAFRINTNHKSLAANIPDYGDLLLESADASHHHVTLPGNLGQERWVGDPLHDDDSGRHGELVTAEGSRMSAGAPCVEGLVVDHNGHGLRPADRLRNQDDIRHDAGVLEGEDLPRAAQPALDLVAYHGDPELPRDPADGPQELDRRRDDPALPLDRLEYDGGGFRDPALGVLQEPLEVVDAGPGPGLPADPQLDAGHDVGDAVLGLQVPGEGHGPVAHPVVATGERYDGASAGGGLAELDGGVGGVGAGRGAELDLGAGRQLRRDDGEQGLHELVLQRSPR